MIVLKQATQKFYFKEGQKVFQKNVTAHCNTSRPESCLKTPLQMSFTLLTIHFETTLAFILPQTRVV